MEDKRTGKRRGPIVGRYTDETGATQPLEPAWDVTGFGNNAAQRVEVNVR